MSWNIPRVIFLVAAVGIVGSEALWQRANAQVKMRPPPRPLTHLESNPDEPSDLPEDQKMAAKLEDAQVYIKLRAWDIAVPHLQHLLKSTGNEDVFATITRTDADGKKTKVMVNVFAETNRLLGSMPKEGKEAYEKRYGAEARVLLKDAKETGDLALLVMIVKCCSHTKAGAEAAALLDARYLQPNKNLWQGIVLPGSLSP
jgi:hypothetical protein